MLVAPEASGAEDSQHAQQVAAISPVLSVEAVQETGLYTIHTSELPLAAGCTSVCAKWMHRPLPRPCCHSPLCCYPIRLSLPPAAAGAVVVDGVVASEHTTWVPKARGKAEARTPRFEAW